MTPPISRRCPRRRTALPRAAVTALACLFFVACRRAAPPEESAAAGAVVARVGAAPITAWDIASQLRRTPGLTPRQALEQRIVFEVLAQAAAAENLPATADDLDAKKKMEVQRLVEREIEPQLRPESIPDSDVRALYERGKRRFVHGRLVRASILCVFTGARMKDAARARAAQTARDLDAYLTAHPARTQAELEALANEPSWANRKVGVTTVWQDETQADPFPAVVAHALGALHRPGDRTPVVGDETGYYLGFYLDEQPPKDESFEAAAPTLRAEMYEPWRRQRFLRLTMDMSSGHDIAVFPENLDLSR